VPLDARVLLLGDESVWAPGGGEAAQGLWLHLRLLFCRAVWAQVCRSRAAGGGMSPAAVVAATAAFIARVIRLDRLRGTASLHGGAVLPSWCVIDGKTFQLTQEQFQERWCASDILAHCCRVCCRRLGAACSCAAPPPVVYGWCRPVCGAGQPPDDSMLWRVLVYVVVDLAANGFRWLACFFQRVEL
jgi:hypothetical protein